MIEYILGISALSALYLLPTYKVGNYIKTYLFPEKTLSVQTIYIDTNGNIDESKTVENLFINDSKCSFNEWQSYENYCDELIREVSNNPEKYKEYDAVIVRNKLTSEELVVYSLFGRVYLDRTPRM